MQTLADERPDFTDVERRCLTAAGFAHTLKSHVLQGLNDMAWAALKAFGYEWSAVPEIPASLATTNASFLVPPGTGFGLHLRQLTPSLAYAAPAHRDACFVLTTPAGVDLRSSNNQLLLDELRAPDARSTGAGYLAGLFWQHSGGKNTLDPEDVARMFEATPPRAHPFGALFPFTSVHNVHGGISLSAWLGLWNMLLAVNAPLALASLYELGYCTVGYAPVAASSDGGGQRICLIFDPRGTAAHEDVRRSRRAPFAPAATRVIAVLGSKGAGKSTLVQHVIGGSAQMQSAAVVAAARSDEEAAALASTPLHCVVAPAPELVVSAADREARRRIVDAAEARPAAMVLTVSVRRTLSDALFAPSQTIPRHNYNPTTRGVQEWPTHMTSTALDDENAPGIDAVVFVVDAACEASISFLLRWIGDVPDGVPTVVVATLHEGRGKEANAAGLELLAKLCSDAPNVSLLAASGAAALRKDPSATAPLPTTSCGLSVQLFRFVLKVRLQNT